jgi:hypothetical protein
MKVERKISIARPPAEVFSYIAVSPTSASLSRTGLLSGDASSWSCRGSCA